MEQRISGLESEHRWIPPAGLERSRPRLVKLTASGKIALALAIALGLAALAAGAGLGRVAAREAAEARLLQEDGLVTDGQVTRLWRSGDNKDQPRVAYRFIVNGRVYAQDARLPLRIWRGLRVGSDLPIRYAGARPELNFPEGYVRRPLPPWVPVLAAVALAAGGFCVTLPIRSQSRLLTAGRVSAGRVTSHGKAMRSSHGANLGQPFTYEFPLLSGAVSKGKAGPSKNPPVIGSIILVLYDPENPRRNAPYPLSLVRLPRTSTD